MAPIRSKPSATAGATIRPWATKKKDYEYHRSYLSRFGDQTLSDLQDPGGYDLRPARRKRFLLPALGAVQFYRRDHPASSRQHAKPLDRFPDDRRGKRRP